MQPEIFQGNGVGGGGGGGGGGLVDLGLLFNISSVTQEKEAPQVNILEILKPFFPKSGHFF